MEKLRSDHTDSEHFIGAKRTAGELTNVNLSVLVTEAFMLAVETDADWSMLFPLTKGSARTAGAEIIKRAWPGREGLVPCVVYKRLAAKVLWQRIVDSAYQSAEPGVLFIDRINRLNNLDYCESISATNPCGEIPLPPYGACNLGSLNLTRFIKAPFSPNAALDHEALGSAATDAVRMLDNVIDISRYPLPEQETQAKAARRIGLGITGLADALIMQGLYYGSEQGRMMASAAMDTIRNAAYRASVELAKEKGAFPLFNKTHYLTRPFIHRLPESIQEGIRQHGIRNSHLIAIAPTGTISLLANNISSGIEPVFEFEHRRLIRGLGEESRWYELTDYALHYWREHFPGRPLPENFVNARSLPPSAHLAMQAALQPYVDSAISKTINTPADCPLQEFSDIFRQANEHGLKGCTAYRPNAVTGAVLGGINDESTPSHCCGLDREDS